MFSPEYAAEGRVERRHIVTVAVGYFAEVCVIRLKTYWQHRIQRGSRSERYRVALDVSETVKEMTISPTTRGAPVREARLGYHRPGEIARGCCLDRSMAMGALAQSGGPLVGWA